MKPDADFLFKPTPHEEAVAFIASKPVVSREVFAGLLPELRARAFTISGVESAGVVQGIRDRIADLPAGANWEDVKKDLVADLHPWLASEEDPSNTIAAERRAELLMRMHGFQAYQSASYQVMDAHRDAFPFWQYKTREDDLVRPEHSCLDGRILPADHEFWQTHFPPWAFGCRCQAIPISAEDAAAIQEEQKDKPADQQDVLSPAALADLTATRRLVNNGVAYNVSAPSESGKPGAFRWNPADLRLTPGDLRGRYDATTFAEFESWARKTAIDSKATVWSWMNGEPLPILPIASSVLAGTLVSAALEITTKGVHRKMAIHALGQIDRVHSDGVLPTIPVGSSPGKKYLGVFVRTHAGDPISISVKASGPWPHLTLCHEIGHFLDWSALGEAGKFGSEDFLFSESWMKAVKQSQAVADIMGATLDAKTLAYFLSGRELWARCYAQFIATKSGDPILLNELKESLAGISSPWRQWTDKDFAPIMTEMETLFKNQGWL